MIRKTGLIVVLILFSTSFLRAQYRTYDNQKIPRLTFGPEVGFFKSNDADNGKFLFGLALRSRLTPALGLEGDINYRQDSYANDMVTFRTWPVTVSADIFIIPYLYGVAGIGWYFTTIDYANSINDVGISDQTKNTFGFHLGGGTEIPITSNTWLKGELRYVFLNYNLKDITQIPLSNINSNFWSVTVGFLIGL